MKCLDFFILMLKKSLHIKLKSHTDIDVPVESYYNKFQT